MLQHLEGVLHETFLLWNEMGVYLVFGFIIAGVLSRVLKSGFIIRHLGHNTFGAIFKASLFGVPLPLCSCGVIPVGLSLFRRGASPAATTSFLISTPQTGVDSILVTYGLLGPVFAIVRPIAAFLNGILGGVGAAFLGERGQPSGQSPDSCCSSDASAPTEGPGTAGPLTWIDHVKGALHYAFVEFPREIAGWLVVGIVVAGIAAYIMPENFLAQHIGGGFRAMALMAVTGIPLYICSTSSIPFVAVLVVHGGLSAGGALVFLITGPATNAASLILIARTLGKRIAAIYLTSIIATSFLFGYLLDVWYATTGTTLAFEAAQHAEMLPHWLMLAGGIGLLIIVASGLGQNWLAAWRLRRRPAEIAPEEEILELQVEGMTCGNCARHVAQAAQALTGVSTADVDLKTGAVRIVGPALDRLALVEAIESAGYRVV